MPIVGWLYKRLNIRLMVGFGLSAIVYSYYLLAHLSLDASFLTLLIFGVLFLAVMPLLLLIPSREKLVRKPGPETED